MTTSVRKSRTEVHDATTPGCYVPGFCLTRPFFAGPAGTRHITQPATKPGQPQRRRTEGGHLRPGTEPALSRSAGPLWCRRSDLPRGRSGPQGLELILHLVKHMPVELPVRPD